MGDVEHDISRLEKAVHDAQRVLDDINAGNPLPDVLEIIRLPGWTSSSEFVFTLAMAESITRELENARRTMQGLLAGARRVSGT